MVEFRSGATVLPRGKSAAQAGGSMPHSTNGDRGTRGACVGVGVGRIPGQHSAPNSAARMRPGPCGMTRDGRGRRGGGHLFQSWLGMHAKPIEARRTSYSLLVQPKPERARIHTVSTLFGLWRKHPSALLVHFCWPFGRNTVCLRFSSHAPPPYEEKKSSGPRGPGRRGRARGPATAWQAQGRVGGGKVVWQLGELFPGEKSKKKEHS